MSELSRYEQKRARREERERERRLARRNKKIVRYGILALILVGTIIGIGALIRSANEADVAQSDGELFSANETGLTEPGEFFAEIGREHVTETPPLETYNSLPPTSGPHFGQQTNWGIHAESISEGYQMHNLEHGGVLIQYKPDLAEEIVERLQAVGEGYDWKKIILAPYPPLDTDIALTAWERLDKFDEFDETRITAFIDAYRNRGPENVPDNIQSVELP